ncbi:MAG: SPOR domain-containing protein [Alphaproteobacteria bacterium]|nr:SPOR domain-containing protein [Alphaproteobacteria bacterium]
MVRYALVLVGMMLSCVPALAGGVADADAGVARLSAGDVTAAVELFTRAIQSKELSPEGLALTYHHRGMAFHKQGQAGRAILDYTTALWNRNLPREFKPRTLNNRGLAFEAINDFDSAMRDYSLAIRLNQNYAEAFSNRGSLHRRFNRHELAIVDYDLALRNGHPYPKFVFTWQGMSLEALGKRREAMDAYRRALSIDASFELAKTRLSKLEDTQGLDTVLGRRKVARGPSPPLVLTATPGSQSNAVSTESEAMHTPWSPPAAKTPSIATAPSPEPQNGFSLRPAFDDQQKGMPATEASSTDKSADIATPSDTQSGSRSSSPVSSVASTANGRGGSDVEYGIQVGSFKTADLAESAWLGLLGVAGDLLDGLSHVIEPVKIPEKGTVYRLYAEALPDKDAALGLCRTLRDKGAVCIVVRR